MSILKQEQVTISEKSVYRRLKENNQDNVNNKTFSSIVEADFDDSFGMLEEESIVKTNEDITKEDYKGFIEDNLKKEDIRISTKEDNESVEEYKTDL